MRRLEGTMVYKKERWSFAFLLLVGYILRIWVHGGFYVVSYILGLYLLQLGIMYVTPVGLPDLDDEEEEDDDEYALSVLPGFEE